MSASIYAVTGRRRKPTPPDIPEPPHPDAGLPPVPTREAILRGQFTLQGLTVTTDQFGVMPWWGACWAWLTPSDRALAASQLLALGERICIIQYPDGQALYDEGGQFYSADKFGVLGPWSMEQLALLVRETLGLRGPHGEAFSGVWIFCGGDDGNAGGYHQSADEVQRMGPVLARAGLIDYTLVLPGWDGVWHKPDHIGTGYTPEQIKSFSDLARAAGFTHVGIEGGHGYLLCGEGGGDYLPGGNMSGYDLILSEYADGEFTTGNFWQIMGRYCEHYVMPPDQKAIIAAGPPTPNPPDSLFNQANDQHPPWVLAPGSARGPYRHRAFEYRLYTFVRGMSAGTVRQWQQHFIDAGGDDTC